MAHQDQDHNLTHQPWYGVDLDGTLAQQVHPFVETEIGPPVPAMLARVRAWVAAGRRVKVVTARAAEGDPAVIRAVQVWCRLHVGRELEVTASKDYHMVELWDDRAVQVEHNTGRRVDGADAGVDPQAVG